MVHLGERHLISTATVSRAVRSPTGARVLKYATGSVIAAGCSEAGFLIAFGLLHTGSTVASVLGWLSGAVPNYFLNRSWTWQRKGRHDLLREVLPYAAIVLAIVGLASLSTHYASVLAPTVTDTHWLGVLIVGGVFLGTYAVLFVGRFLLLDLLFRGRPRSRHQVPNTTRAYRQP